MKKALTISVLVSVCAIVLSAFGQSGTDRLTVWSGVYTEAQSAQGQAVFGRCERCHGNDLTGGATGTSLIGDRFMQFWREDNLDSLFKKISETMPRNAGGTLTDAEYVQVTTYILQKNGFPSGSSELKVENMHTIHIEAKDGPKPLPNNSMIQIVGCMTPDGNDGWILTKAGSPSRTRTPDNISPDDLKVAQKTSLGTAAYRLQNLMLLGAFNAEGHKGHKMLAKGPLIRRATGEAVSVTALDMVGENCN